MVAVGLQPGLGIDPYTSKFSFSVANFAL